MIFHRKILFLIAAAILAGAGTASAQDEAGSARQMLQIEVRADDRLPDGKSAFIQGLTDAIGQKFVLSDTGITQPIAVGVYTEHPDDDVQVQIIKDDWEHPEREGSTAGSGKLEFDFRTFDGFKLKLSAAHETAYQLVVWVGDEPPVAMPAIAVPASRYDDTARPAATAAAASPRNGAVSLSYFELGLIAVVVLLGGAITVLLMRRKRA